MVFVDHETVYFACACIFGSVRDAIILCTLSVLPLIINIFSSETRDFIIVSLEHTTCEQNHYNESTHHTKHS